jgi:lysozyme
MNKDLKLSDAGVNLVQHYESCLQPHGKGKYKSYKDPVGVLTIGWGHTNHHPPKITADTVWTREECDDVFRRDMEIFEKTVRRMVKVELNQEQFDALVSFTFNLGEGNLGKSTLLKKLNAGDYAGAGQEFHKWNKAGGKELRGLTRRRKSESNVFLGKPDPHYPSGTK